jgi:hypothetical protein
MSPTFKEEVSTFLSGLMLTSAEIIGEKQLTNTDIITIVNEKFMIFLLLFMQILSFSFSIFIIYRTNFEFEEKILSRKIKKLTGNTSDL